MLVCLRLQSHSLWMKGWPWSRHRSSFGSKTDKDKRTGAGCRKLQCIFGTMIPVHSKHLSCTQPRNWAAPLSLWYWCPLTPKKCELAQLSKMLSIWLLINWWGCLFVFLPCMVEFPIFPRRLSQEQIPERSDLRSREFIERMCMTPVLYSRFSTTGFPKRWAVTNGFTLCSLSEKRLFR